MARTTSTNYSTPSFPKASADTDPFDAFDVQQLAAAVDGHDHSSGKGLAAAIAVGTITSAMIADATIDTADLKDGAVTSVKILDGTIATADLADRSVTNAKLGTDTARANLLTNGGFEIWQRGNGPFTATTAYAADRWFLSIQGSSTLSVSRDTSNTDGGGGACLAATYTHNTASSIQQSVIESATQLRSKTVTLSVRVRTATANAVRIGLYDGISAVTYGSFHSGGGAYETLTVTATLVSNATAMTALLSLNASCTAYFDNAMLVIGSVAADYAPLHPADDLARCLRYYEVIGSDSEWVILGWNNASGGIYMTTPYKAQRPVTPTVTKVGTFGVSNCGQPSADVNGRSGFRAAITATATGNAFSYSSGSAYWTSEANP